MSRGIIDYDQIRASARQGNGLQFQMFGQAAVLSGAISSSATSLVVAANPATLPSTPFVAAFDDGTGEQVNVTATSGTTWTVTRGYNSTTAAAHNNLAVLHCVPTAGHSVIYDAYGNAVDSGGAPFISPLTTKGDLLVYSGSGIVRLGVGSDGKVLTANSAATNGIDWETPSGGGSASLPGMASFAAPPTTGWATLTPGGGTPAISTGTGYITLLTDSTYAYEYYARAKPTAPYATVVHLYTLCYATGGNSAFAVGWADNTGAVVILAGGDSDGWTYQRRNAGGGFNATVSSGGFNGLTYGIWVKLRDDSTNRIVSVSHDGSSWAKVAQESNTAFITPTKLIFGALPTNRVVGGAVQPTGITIDSWQ